MPSEFTLIDDFLARFDPAPKRIARVPAGDDCAVVAPSGEELCVTTDALVENVHFTLPAFSLEDVGHKALAVNLSDVASMGATPRWFLCAIAMPKRFGAREVRAIAKGMSALAREHRIALIGGNFTAAAELSITITAAGGCPKGKALTRAGAHPGDVLYVSGMLGDARLGVSVLAAARMEAAPPETTGHPEPVEGSASLARLSRRDRALLARRQKRPEPRIALGQVALRFASAAIDLSDGLGQDLGHLCASSKVGATIDLSQLPVSRALIAATGSSEAAWEAAAHGGEDYELVLAIPESRARAFERAAAKTGTPVTRIGRIARGREITFVTAEGKKRGPPRGHDHFWAR